MNPPVYTALNVPAVNALVGTRIYANGHAPQGVLRPYITWQIVGGGPGINLSCAPEYDNPRVRVWCYSDESAGTAISRNLGNVARDALEEITHVIYGPVDDYESDTKLLVKIMDADFWDER